jgi:mono/diheme cytochrome c family protein
MLMSRSATDGVMWGMLKANYARAAWTGLCLAVFAGGSLQADELGDIDAGFQFAAQHCAGCHDIKTRNPMTTGSGVPTFATVANTAGITRTSLVVWMQTSHPDMPDLILQPQDLDNVIAYILSLKKS